MPLLAEEDLRGWGRSRESQTTPDTYARDPCRWFQAHLVHELGSEYHRLQTHMGRTNLVSDSMNIGWYTRVPYHYTI